MNYFIIFLLLFTINVCQAEHKYQLSICAIFHNEAPHLKEWIEFHKLVGVDHFYLFNHRSTDHYREILKPYIQSGCVELYEKPKVANAIKIFNRLQCQCYTACLKQAQGVSKWVAFIDIDEFLCPMQTDSILQILRDYEKFAGLGINWRMFGTSFIKKIPEGELMIERLTSCSPKTFTLNRYMKCIVKPECASHFLNPHHPVYLPGFTQVNTDKLPEGPFFSSYIQTNKLRINHYWTRDEHYFYSTKLPRQKKWGVTPPTTDILKKFNEERDEVILKYLPALKKAMTS